MDIKISEDKKRLFAKNIWAIPNKLLLQREIEQRFNEETDNSDFIKIFDRVWEKHLKRSIEKSELCDFDFVRSKISSNSLIHADSKQEHRTFRVKELDLDFIVQLNTKSSNNPELTQIW
ncbi:MAG: hypothetical protein AAGA60_27170, partial [Cyanobacteria bacterium P01_E01_bin.42]